VVFRDPADSQRAGRIVEQGLSERVLGDPQNAYTRELLTAIPHPPVPVH
jgi:peptide/nickel transport system ATP-binding protein